MSHDADVVVVGAGPNGLTAAAVLAKHGLDVRVFELAPEVGGGTRSAELTLPGYVHDVCSAVHTTGILSPAFRYLDLERQGLEWVTPEASVAHPLEAEPAALLEASLTTTAQQLGADAKAYERLLRPWVNAGARLFEDVLNPLGIPRHPWLMARLGWYGLGSARSLASRFESERTRALLAGCAAHSILPLESPLTAAVGLVFLIAGHVHPWPIAKGGSRAIGQALWRVTEALGGRLESNVEVRSLSQLPKARAYVFDLAPAQLANLAADELPSGYSSALVRYRMGPGVFKMDWALSEPIPWRDPECRRAATVHVGGTFDEIADSERCAFEGRHSERPFLIVAQQSLFDPSRAPSGKHTGYAYCHVPNGSERDLTQIVEAQIERFAPGFKQCILGRHQSTAQALERYNPSYIGGAITGGVADLRQFVTRPAWRWDPYSTPNPRLFICSHSTPPGGGVHGMCGLFAASSVLSRTFGRAKPRWRTRTSSGKS
jgi:phytoene dehydrogenase-like protein